MTEVQKPTEDDYRQASSHGYIALFIIGPFFLFLATWALVMTCVLLAGGMPAGATLLLLVAVFAIIGSAMLWAGARKKTAHDKAVAIVEKYRNLQSEVESKSRTLEDLLTAKKLLDEEIISQEEFDAVKNQAMTSFK